MITVAVPTADAMAAIGARLGAALRPGDLIALSGALGAGKTTLAIGAAKAACGAQVEAASPTYALVHRYPGIGGHPDLWHVDLYRIESFRALHDLGIVEQLGGDGACMVEWFERVPELASMAHLAITIDRREESRTLVAEDRGGRHAHLLRAIDRNPA